MNFILTTSLAILALVYPIKAQFNPCNACPEVVLVSQGGIAIQYPRYLGTWNQSESTFNNMPFYMCDVECQGLTDELIYYDGRWQIVDCRPGATACGGGYHSIITTGSVTASVCPENIPIGTFEYCVTELPGGGCQEYFPDPTAEFVCASRKT